MIYPGFAYPTYSESFLGDFQRCINFYPTRTPEGWVLESCPGFKKIGNAGNGAVYRGHLHTGTGQLFAVFGNTVYEIFANGTATSRGTIASSAGDVSMAENGTDLIVVPDGGTSYTVGLASGSPAQIVDANFPSNPIGAEFLDGYLIVGDATNSSFNISELNSASDWTPQTRAFANSISDKIVGLAVIGQRLFVIGKRTIEPWYNTGNPDFPFERVSGGILRIGVTSRRNFCKAGEALFVLAQEENIAGAAYLISSGGMKMVTNETVAAILRNQGAGTNRVFYHEYNGHPWVYVKNTGFAISRCMVYDLVTEQWHERQSFDGSNYYSFALDSGPVIVGLASGREAIAFGSVDDSIYEIGNPNNASLDYADEDGVAIRRWRDFGPISSDTARLFHRRMRIEAEIKHADTASYTVTAVLQKSENMGLSFDSGVSVARAITSGTTAQRVLFDFHNLGSSENRVYRLTFTGPSAYITLRRCDLSIEKGRH